MEPLKHRYITVAYQLFADNSDGIHEIIEEVDATHPYQFITGIGETLDAFEERVRELEAGDSFDFTLSVEEGYGPYEQERVVEIDKSAFLIDGRFDKEYIYPGNMIPLVNQDGQRFMGLVLEVKEDVVVIDFNSPQAGKALHFVGQVVTAREATLQELQGAFNRLAGEDEGCSCGCHGGGDEGCDCGHGGHGHDGEGCGCGHGEHGHDGEGCGCGHKHNHDDDHECCGGDPEARANGTCACMG